MLFFIGIGLQSYAQIDSRNQERPEKQEATTPGKTKKVKKTKTQRKREQGKKIYSNKKQLKQSKKTFKKGGDRPYKGDITGRSVERDRRTPRETYARPQPDPYAARRLRTEADRAGPKPPKIRTATKKGEVPRTGDIAGRKRIRQRSVSTAPRPSYPQPNPYLGRRVRTEERRAYSNKQQLKNVRTVSKPTEVRKPRTTTKVVTATAPQKVVRKRNVYAGHEQRKGETGTQKDIAGRKIRTRNYKSEKPSRGNKDMISPRPRTDALGSGERFKGAKYQPSQIRTISRSGEKGGGGKPMQEQRIMKGFSSTKAKSVVQPKPIRTFGNSKKGTGEAAVFGAYGPKKIRTATRKSESKPGKKSAPPPSISSASVFGYKKAHPYRGKDRRFSGENSTSKDIAGRSLRTKNYRSPRPDYRSVGTGVYIGISPTPPHKNPNPHKAKSVSGKRWNNQGNTLTQKTSGSPVGQFSGNLKAEKRLQGGGSIFRHWNNNGNPLYKKDRGAGTIAASNYRGTSRPKEFGDTGVGRYSGNIKAQKPLQGGGSITRRWNNNGQPLFRSDRGTGTIAAMGYSGTSRPKEFGDTGVGRYSGNIKAQKPLQGGGSVTRRWNNNGQPLFRSDRGSGTIAAMGYTGNSRPKEFGDTGVGRYSGDIKAQKPLQGGGSITRRWNNNGQPLLKQDRGNGTMAATTFQGNVRLTKHKVGGGSITTKWNNNGNPLPKQLPGAGTVAATKYQGNIYPPGMNNPKIGFYQGDIKAKRSVDKPYPTQDFIGNVRVVSKKPPQAPGTEYGMVRKVAGIKMGESGGRMQPRVKNKYEDINTLTAKTKERKASPSQGTELGKTTTLSFISIGNPNRAGLVYQQKRLKVNSNLPEMLSRDEKKRPSAAPGTERGKDWAFSFWEFGDPYKMGLAKKHTVAKSKAHPSATYAEASKSSTEEKEKPVSIKLLWAKLFKKDAATAEPEEKRSHRPRYDKGERIIWETEERENWYKK